MKRSQCEVMVIKCSDYIHYFHNPSNVTKKKRPRFGGENERDKYKMNAPLLKSCKISIF